MPSESSIYRKIQVVLDIAHGTRSDSFVELQNEIAGRQLANFLTRRYDNETDTYQAEVSAKSINRSVGFCRVLELIDDRGRLTPIGRQASQKTKFDTVIASQICLFLERSGVSIEALNTDILKGFRSTPPVLSTYSDLWERVSDRISATLFSKMLNMLTLCGQAESSQRKIFLRINKP